MTSTTEITRYAIVKRELSLMEALVTTGRKPHLNEDVVESMPRTSGNIEAIFVNLGHMVYPDKLNVELAAIGMELIVDPQGLAAINEADPAFADTHHNGIQWKDSEGMYCYMTFYRCLDERSVNVGRIDSCWKSGDWFPCRRKLAP